MWCGRINHLNKAEFANNMTKKLWESKRNYNHLHNTNGGYKKLVIIYVFNIHLLNWYKARWRNMWLHRYITLGEKHSSHIGWYSHQFCNQKYTLFQNQANSIPRYNAFNVSSTSNMGLNKEWSNHSIMWVVILNYTPCNSIPLLYSNLPLNRLSQHSRYNTNYCLETQGFRRKDA